MAKRELSFLQKAYRSFFLGKLEKYQVNSPAQLSKEQKSEFFKGVKEEWRIKKAELLSFKTKNKSGTKKENYAKLKVSRPAVAIAPAVKNKRKSKQKKSFSHLEDEPEIITLKSEINPEQTDDSKINFHPNQFFEQDEPYQYPVIKMPVEGSFVKLPRKGRAMGKGFKEQDFYEAIKTSISNIEVVNDLHLSIPFYNKPYEPDIVLIDQGLNLYIDIEIDEPYDGYFRFPTHEQQKDDIRDLFFTESGWIVIKFTERQVHLQEQECVELIKDVIDSIRNYTIDQSSRCRREPQWDYQQAVRWHKSNYREKYLGIEKFGKQISSSRIEVDVEEFDPIENNINRTKKYASNTFQENIAFEDETHKYHHPKDETGNAEYISVTTLIDRFFPFDMERFIQTKAKREERTKEDVMAEFLATRDEAAEKGTFLHEQIELFLKGEEHKSSFKEFEMFKTFYDQIVIAKGFQFVEAEKKILLEDFNVAGTVDALFKKPNREEYLIVDWKRSKKLVIDDHPKKYGYGNAISDLNHIDNSSYYKYALQQNIYKYILETEYDMPISSMNLIVLHENYDKYSRVNLENMDKEVAIILNSINHKI